MSRDGESASSAGPSASASASAVPPVARRVRAGFGVPVLAIVLIVAACGIAFAALGTASKEWHEATYTFTVFVLLVAVLASRFRRGRERAFWFGFAVFGWAFFLLGYRPWMNAFGEASEDGAGSPYNPLLLTSRLIVYLLPRLRKPTNAYGAIDAITDTTLGIAHLLMTLLVGVVGGLIAILLWRRPRARWSTKMVSILVALALVASVGISFASGGRRAPFIGWVGRQQIAFGEDRPLSDAAGAGALAVYRMIWVPTFHHSVCVRIERAGVGARLRVKVLDGLGGYEAGQIAIDRSLSLTEAQWGRFEQFLAESRFWQSSRWSQPFDGEIMDGDVVVFEGFEAGRSHGMREKMLDPAPVRLCAYLLELTGIVGVGTVWEEYHPGSSEDEPG